MVDWSQVWGSSRRNVVKRQVSHDVVDLWVDREGSEIKKEVLR